MSNDMAHTPIRIGLTGGIGSGKSTVAGFLRELGAEVIDADAISRASTQAGGSAMPHIEEVFGQTFVSPDGSLDRERMRERIFSDPAARAQLEAIVHPLVAKAIRELSENAQTNCLVFDIPLLVENRRWRPQLDLVWVVDCETRTQISRVMVRSGWDDVGIRAVIQNQSPRLARVAAADAVLFNEGLELSDLRTMVKQLAVKFGL
ncbi:MAG: dephospho-CoA kinase [Burkholderiaceae bacterium]